jgi:hypothetical protein
VGVAQLVERQVVVLDAAGSSPVTHPTVSAGQRLWSGNGPGPLAFQCPILGARWERLVSDNTDPPRRRPADGPSQVSAVGYSVAAGEGRAEEIVDQLLRRLAETAPNVSMRRCRR